MQGVEQVTERFTGKVSGRNMVSNGIYGMIGKCGRYFVGEAIDKLAEYETAEEEGRLVVLPCKIGQTVYKIIREPWGFWIGTIPFMFKTRRDIGKTVFLTRKEAEKVIEEAEKALKEMEEKMHE